ncbi:hypothetical protein DL96DRAFT_1590645 [Flagelloscypha sp. PMI_526]|nr:hypothetical protein DL96DRAFT_1590645 [Flagelloscypha sp. PMI_526]
MVQIILRPKLVPVHLRCLFYASMMLGFATFTFSVVHLLLWITCFIIETICAFASTAIMWILVNGATQLKKTGRLGDYLQRTRELEQGQEQKEQSYAE